MTARKRPPERLTLADAMTRLNAGAPLRTRHLYSYEYCDFQGRFPLLERGEFCEARREPVVYGLVDTREPHRVRYVGQTVCPRTRLGSHIAEALPRGSLKDQWIFALRKEGRFPDMVLLERVANEDRLLKRERHWIVKLDEEGQADLNSEPFIRWARVRRAKEAGEKEHA